MQKVQIDLKGREYAAPSALSVALQNNQILCASGINANGPSYGEEIINL